MTGGESLKKGQKVFKRKNPQIKKGLTAKTKKRGNQTAITREKIFSRPEKKEQML